MEYVGFRAEIFVKVRVFSCSCGNPLSLWKPSLTVIFTAARDAVDSSGKLAGFPGLSSARTSTGLASHGTCSPGGVVSAHLTDEETEPQEAPPARGPEAS